MTQFNYNQARTYASQYGLVVGLFWIISFSSYMGGLNYPILSHVGLFMGIASLFVTGNIIRFYHNMREELSFKQAWWMAMLLYVYATILLAIAQYIYFRYLDNGMLIMTYENIINSPEYQKMLEQTFPDASGKEALQQTVDLLYTITPIQMTLQLFMYNLFLSLILSLPTALLGRRKKRLA